jgi:hypothetical protein
MSPYLSFNFLHAFLSYSPLSHLSISDSPLSITISLYWFFSLIFSSFVHAYNVNIVLSFNQSAAYSTYLQYIWIVTPTVGLIVFITFDDPDTGASFSNPPPPIRRQSLKRSQIASLFKGTDSQDGTGKRKVRFFTRGN